VRDFLQTLPNNWPGQGEYTIEHQIHDFRAVFATDIGRRVFAQIARSANGTPVTESSCGNHPKMAFGAGRVWLAAWIGTVITGLTKQEVEVEYNDG